MTGSEIKTLAESILDNNVEWTDEFFYQLLNISKTKLEEMRLWQFLKKLDTSNSVAAGNHYTTGITVPTDFAEDYKVIVGSSEYLPVPFEESYNERNSSCRYYIDFASGAIYVLGNSAGGTLQFFYKRFTPDIASTTSPVFPARFHPILAYFVAAYYEGGVDTDDIFARMSPVNQAAGNELLRAMIMWNTSISLRMQNDRVGMQDGGDKETPLGLM
jgi:hypothetical protein